MTQAPPDRVVEPESDNDSETTGLTPGDGDNGAWASWCSGVRVACEGRPGAWRRWLARAMAILEPAAPRVEAATSATCRMVSTPLMLVPSDRRFAVRLLAGVTAVNAAVVWLMVLAR